MHSTDPRNAGFNVRGEGRHALLPDVQDLESPVELPVAPRHRVVDIAVEARVVVRFIRQRCDVMAVAMHLRVQVPTVCVCVCV